MLLIFSLFFLGVLISEITFTAEQGKRVCHDLCRIPADPLLICKGSCPAFSLQVNQLPFRQHLESYFRQSPP